MIQLTGKLICKNLDESKAVRRFLPEHIRLTKNEPGCVSFAVQATTDPLIWTVEELFLDQKSFDAHQIRTKQSRWAVETAAIVREYEMQEVA